MSSILSNVLPAPEDPVLSVIFACRDDPCPVKLNLSAGAYRTEEGKPLVLEVVRKAEQQLANDLGNLDSDAQSVRMFVADGGECLIAQSFAKNMGLYGERIGALTIVCTSQDVARKVHSQVLLVVRPMYLSPPIHGASIVTTIFKNSDMYKDWTIELKGMADRIISMRQQLYEAIQARGTPGDWTHIIKQIGMFSFTGLNEKQVRWMAKEYHIYMTYDGRISIASLSSKTVPQLADAIHAAVTRIA
ncbi:hypothetical protein F2Q69_00014003 [Brassica cretica]|uniref:Aspartate aminotransferase n=1 Tax=Brassica cretica TaxID=69181 RepID=A0A8S9QYD6_BRACR|nr:hypothetical protein F2Q69_00014003 [Brassica cretica]